MEKSRTKPKLVLPENDRASLERELARQNLYGDSKPTYERVTGTDLVPDSDTFLERFNRNLDHYIEMADEEFDLSDFQRFKVRREVVLAAEKAALDFIEELHERFPQEFASRSMWKLRKWMLKDDAIREMLERTKFEEVYVYLWNKTMKLEESQELADRYGIGKHRTKVQAGKMKGQVVERDYVIVFPDHDDMATRLQLSRSSVQKYLRALCKVGVLVDLKKLGSTGQKAYAMGSWSPYGTGGLFRRNSFLKNTKEMRDGLRGFRVWSQK